MDGYAVNLPILGKYHAGVTLRSGGTNEFGLRKCIHRKRERKMQWRVMGTPPVSKRELLVDSINILKQSFQLGGSSGDR